MSWVSVGAVVAVGMAGLVWVGKSGLHGGCGERASQTPYPNQHNKLCASMAGQQWTPRAVGRFALKFLVPASALGRTMSARVIAYARRPNERSRLYGH